MVFIRKAHPFRSLLLLLSVVILLAACGDEPSETSTGAVAFAPTAAVKERATAALPVMRSFTSLDLSFTVEHPVDWKMDQAKAEENGVLIYRADGQAAFWVQRQRFGGSAAQANAAGIAFLQRLNSGPSFRELTYIGEPAPYAVAGLTGLRVDYTYTAPGNVPKRGALIAVTTDAGDTYLLNLEAPATEYAALQPIFERMLQIFRISGVAAVGTAPATVAPPAERSEAEWLIMLYSDADDNVIERDSMIDLNEIERIGSTDQVQIVAQVDRYRGAFSGMGNWTTAKRFFIVKDDDLGRIASPELADLGEVNMADGKTLTDFITWALVNYPARRHMLILADHGSGWPGGFSDYAPGGKGPDKVALAEDMDDNLWLMEIDQALADARAKTGLDKFEVIGFDACLMGMLEVYTAIAPHARYAVASEETEPLLGWAYTSFLERLTANPAMSGAELTRAVVEGYIAQDQRLLDSTARRQLLREYEMDEALDAKRAVKEFSVDITMAAVDLGAIPALNSALDGLADLLPDLPRRQVTAARTHAQSFESTFDPDLPPSYIDLGNFVQLISEKSDDRDVDRAAAQVLAALKRAVVVERHGPERPGATGIAFYFPNQTLYEQEDNWDYTQIAARFAGDSRWDDFLAVHYGGKSSGRATRQHMSRTVALSKPVQIAPLQLSAETAAPGHPIGIRTTVSSANLGYIYTFVGRVLPSEGAILIEDMDYLFADQIQEVGGVTYPVWPEGEVAVDFEWEPRVYALNDGVNSVRALLMPQAYGDVPTYAVEGAYKFADGSPARFARLFFRDGELSAVFGSTGQGGVGAPRQITPQPGDTFTVTEKGHKLVDGRPEAPFSREGGTLTFGNGRLTVEELPAPGGSYLVGLIAEDLDGERAEQYEAVFVRNTGAVDTAGFVPYESQALGFALLRPGNWTVEEDFPGETVTFQSPASSAQVIIYRDRYPDAASAEEANLLGITDAMQALQEDGELTDVRFTAQSDRYLLGAYPAEQRDITFALDGEAFRGTLAVATPLPGTTYGVMAFALADEFDAAQASIGPLLASFDISLSGVSKQQAGPPAPTVAPVAFTDAYTDPTSGLEEDEGDWGHTGYTAGRFVVDLAPYGGPLYDYYADEVLPDKFAIEARAGYTGAADNGYGLIFRVTDEEDFYTFRISGDGFYTVERTQGEDLITLIDWTASDLILTGEGAANLLTVAGDSDRYTLYINGRQADAFTDDAFRQGAFGVITDNFDEGAPASFFFDDYKMGQPTW